LTLGWVYAVSGEYARAQEAYELGLRRIHFSQKPTLGADLLNNLGRVQEKLGDLQQARDYYRKSLRWNPSQGDARHNLARLRSK
jgi:tetratricopeptide (TPR) repeat protein